VKDWSVATPVTRAATLVQSLKSYLSLPNLSRAIAVSSLTVRS